MKNRILGAGASLLALVTLPPLAACLGGSSASPNGDDGGGQGGDDSAAPTSTSTGTATGTSTGNPPSGDGGSSSGGGTGMAIVPDPNGYVGPSTNSLGIQGAWYAYGDDLGTNGAPPGVCETKGMHMASACSLITFPPPAMLSDAGGDAGLVSSFTQTTPGSMCLSGTAAKVVGSDYTNMFGIGIGLDLNNQNGVKMTYDATMNKVVGFSFDISGVPTGASLRVELPIPATDTSGDAWSTTVTADGSYTLDLSSAAGDVHGLKPSFAPPAGMTEPAFDATKIESLQFHVVTNTTAAVTIPASPRLCVANLKAIVGM